MTGLGGIISALFWLLFIFLAFMPAYQRHMLAAGRLRLLHRLERKRGRERGRSASPRRRCRSTLSCTRRGAWSWRRSRFLLEREPKESILSRFDLPIISRYFPEYEEEIGERLGLGIVDHSDRVE